MDVDCNNKERCCGCYACVETCPTSAIHMQRDQEGFYYPEIDQNKCVNCGKCKNVCQFHIVADSKYKQRYFAAKSKDILERLRSRSGGAFYCIAKAVINNDGVVYGAALSSDNTIKYVRGTSWIDCIQMQGSKYVEANIVGIYKKIKNDLDFGRLVFFAGTPCHVAGLFGYVGWSHENLITADIVCHGVPSTQIFKDYIDFLEKKYKDRVRNFNFRDKSYGWNTHIETFFVKGRKVPANRYTSLFYSNCGLRPSCGKCPFARYNRPGDFTLADFWGLKQKIRSFDDNKGVSAVIVNSERAETYLSQLNQYMDLLEVDQDICSQTNLYMASTIPPYRNEFWTLYRQKGFIALLRKYGRYDITRRILWHIRDYPRLNKQNSVDKGEDNG